MSARTFISCDGISSRLGKTSMGRVTAQAPVNDDDVATKKYVDDAAGGGTITTVTLTLVGGSSDVEISATLSVNGKTNVLSIPPFTFTGANSALTDSSTPFAPISNMSYPLFMWKGDYVGFFGDFNIRTNGTVLVRHLYAVFDEGDSWTTSGGTFVWLSA